MRIARVFPVRTSYTPDDAMAFVGDPPLWLPAADEVHVSATFTWDLPEARRLVAAWSNYYPVVKLGGPATGDPGGEFEPGLYVKQGVTFTSRGCNNHCPWCLVPEREGGLRLLDVRPGWIVQDNNLLQTGREHMSKVFGMLKAQRRACRLVGGLEARLLDSWAVEQLRGLHIDELWLAADTLAALGPLADAVKKLEWLPRRKLRCYVMIGRGESLGQAEERLREVWAVGALPFAQLYQPPAEKALEYGPEWKALQRTWSRPAAMFSVMERGQAYGD